MQLKVMIKLNEPLVLPIAYNHILQSALYELGRKDNSDYANNMHSEYRDGSGQIYRYMCFSLINGKHNIHRGRISFYDEACFEVRSICDSWLYTVESELKQNGIRFGNVVYRDVETKLTDLYIDQPDIMVKMLSPIAVHSTDRETNKSVFYSPLDREFGQLINTNYRNKFRKLTGRVPPGNIFISPVKVTPEDKFVTRYKGFYYITAWNGVYCISGEPEALSFLYDTGIGTRNSQGFGLMEII